MCLFSCQRLRENQEMLAQERADRERERWSLLRHARDEAERSLALAAQLDIKDQQLSEVCMSISLKDILIYENSTLLLISSISRRIPVAKI